MLKSICLRANLISGLAALGLLCAKAESSFAQTVKQALNSRVALEVPDSFTASDRFSGFVDDKSGASFVIVELPAAAWAEVKDLADRTDVWAKQGIVEVIRRELPGRMGDYVFITGKQKAPTGDYSKYILIARDSSVTMTITANVPETSGTGARLSRSVIERAFVTARVRAEVLKAVELFTLSYLGAFKERQSVMGGTKSYGVSGKISDRGTPAASEEPIFVVSPSVDKRPVTDVKALAKRSFMRTGNLTRHEVKSEKGVTVAGLQGYEIIGEGDDPKTGRRTGLYVLLLSGGAGYYVMAGLAPATRMPTFLPEFQKIAMSFSPRADQ